MKKKDVSVSPSNKTETLDKFFQYFELSGLLFDRSRDEIYNVTDIPSENKFFKMAKNTAKELQIKWNGMSHEDSNRVMLAMLEEAFNLIRDIEQSKNITLNVTIKVK